MKDEIMRLLTDVMHHQTTRIEATEKLLNLHSDLIKKIKEIRPTIEQSKGRDCEYSFGWIDARNAIIEQVINNDK